MRYSKVVHCRIPLTTLASCVLLLETMGIPVKGISLSTLVVQSLSGLTKGMEREGHLAQIVSTEEAVDILNRVESIILPSTAIPVAEDFLDEHETLPPEPFVMPDLKGNIEDILNQTPDSGIAADASTPLVQEPERGEVIVHLKDQTRLTFEYIEEESDKDDILVESVRGNRIGEMALGVVYENLTRNMWGSDTAKQLVVQLIEGENKI